MVILLIGPYYQNFKHGAEVGIFDALKSLGHEVAVWDYRINAYLTTEGLKIATATDLATLADLTKNESWDLVLCPGAGLPPVVLESPMWAKIIQTGAMRILWNSEPIRLPEYRAKVEAQKKNFHLTCTFDESEIPLYRDMGIQAIWLPQAFNPKWYSPLMLPQGQKFEGYLVFCGSVGGKWVNRVYLLDQVRKLGFKVNVATLFDGTKVNRAYNMHDAVLNLGLYVPVESGPIEELRGFGLQQRIFESIGAGKVCITNAIPAGTNELFEDKETILYFTGSNLQEVLAYAMNKKERVRMEESINKVREQHTYKARMERLLSVIDW